MSLRAKRESLDVRRFQHRCADYSVSLYIASSAFNSGSLVTPRIVGSVCVQFGPGHPLNRTDIFYPNSEGYMPPDTSIEPRAGIIARRSLLQGLLSALVATKDIYRIGRASSCLHINTSSTYLDSLWNDWLPEWEKNGWPRQEPRLPADSYDVSSVVSSDQSHGIHSNKGSMRRPESIASTMYPGSKRNSAAPSVAGSFMSNVSDSGIAFDPETGVLVNEDLLRKVAVFRRNFFVNERQAGQGGAIIVRVMPARENPADRSAKEAARAAAAELTTQIAIGGERPKRRSIKAAAAVGKPARHSMSLPPESSAGGDRLRNFSRPQQQDTDMARKRSSNSRANAATLDDTYAIPEEEDAPPSPAPVAAAKRERSQTSKSRKEALAASAALGGLGAAGATQAARNRKSKAEEEPASPVARVVTPEEKVEVPSAVEEEQPTAEPLVPARKSRRIPSLARTRKAEEKPVEEPAAVEEAAQEPEVKEPLTEPSDSTANGRLAPRNDKTEALALAEEGEAPVKKKPSTKKVKIVKEAKSPKKKASTTRKAVKKVEPQPEAEPEVAAVKEADAVPAVAVEEVAPVVSTSPPTRLAQTRAHSRMSLLSARSGAGTDTENEVFDDARSGFGDAFDVPSGDAPLASTQSAQQLEPEAVEAPKTELSEPKEVVPASEATQSPTVQQPWKSKFTENVSDDEPSLFARVAGGAAAAIGLGGSAAAMASQKKGEEHKNLDTTAEDDVNSPSRLSQDLAREMNEAFDGIGDDKPNKDTKAAKTAKKSATKTTIKTQKRKQGPKAIAIPEKQEPKRVLSPSRSVNSLESPTKLRAGSGVSTPLEKKKPVHPFEREQRPRKSRRSIDAAGALEVRPRSRTPSSSNLLDKKEDDAVPRNPRRESRIRNVRSSNLPSSIATSPNATAESRPPTKSRSMLFGFGRKRSKSSATSPLEEESPTSPLAGERIARYRSPDELEGARSPQRTRDRTSVQQKKPQQLEEEDDEAPAQQSAKDRRRARQSRLNSSSSSDRDALAEDTHENGSQQPPVNGKSSDVSGKPKKKRFAFFHRLLSR